MNFYKTILSTVLLSVFFSQATLAENTNPAPAFVDAPPPPPPVMSGEVLEPDVTIRRTERNIITEYRIHGKLYMVKINPRNAPSYYLMDANGDGQLESRRNELGVNFQVPNWVLYSW